MKPPRKSQKKANFPHHFPLIRRFSRIFVAHLTLIMNKETQRLIDTVIAGIQEKKGRDIVVADLTETDSSICEAFVICTGGSPQQVQAVAQSIGETALEQLNARPLAVDGMRGAMWVAMDYGQLIVHVMLPDTRTFYDIEHLWADASLTAIPDVDALPASPYKPF